MYLDHGPTEKHQKIIPDKKLLDDQPLDPFLPHPSEHGAPCPSLGHPCPKLGAPMPKLGHFTFLALTAIYFVDLT